MNFFLPLRTALCGLFLLISFFSEAQWQEKNNGVFGGAVNSILSFGANVYVGTSGGVYVSTDGGDNWSAVNNGLTYTYIYALASDGSNLYAATDYGLFVSSDNAATWTSLGGGSGFGYVGTICFNDGNIFIGSQSGVNVSKDGGASWAEANNGFTSMTVNWLASSNGTLFAATSDGLFRSTDNGDNWTLTDVTDSPIMLAANGTKVFTSTFADGLLLSTNGGDSWAPVNNGLPSAAPQAMAFGNGASYCFAYPNVFKSIDDGANWTQLTYVDPYVQALAVSGTKLFAGTQGKVFVSADDGTIWTEADHGRTSTTVRAFAVSGTTIFAATFGNGIFSSADQGETWSAVNNGLTELYVKSLLAHNGVIFAGLNQQGLMRSTDGVHWNPASVPNFTGPLITDGTNIFAGAYNGVYISDNDGDTWTPMVDGLTSSIVNALTLNGGNLFAGTQDGVYVSTDNGASWNAVNNGLPGGNIYGLVTVNGIIFAACENGLYASSDNGTSWATPAMTVSFTHFSSLATEGNHLFGGNYYTSDVYFTVDEGTNWVISQIGLPSSGVNAVCVYDGNVFAGVTGYGIWSQPYSNFRVEQSITFDPISARTIGDAAFDVSATANSGLPITYASGDVAVATVSGKTVTLLKAGTAKITASQAGNDDYFAAVDAIQTFCINPLPPSVTVDDPSADIPVLTSSAATGNQWLRDGTAVDGATDNTYAATASGSYTVEVTEDGCTSEPSDPVAIMITGINEPQEAETRIFPTLVTDYFYVRSRSNPDNPVLITDMMGRNFTCDQIQSGNLIQVDARVLHPGIFLVHVQDAGNSVSRIIKQ